MGTLDNGARERERYPSLSVTLNVGLPKTGLGRLGIGRSGISFLSNGPGPSACGEGNCWFVTPACKAGASASGVQFPLATRFTSNQTLKDDMSKSNLFDQPGVEQMIPGKELPVAVKVTGRNMHAVSLLVSVAGEQTGVRTAVSAFFESDGSLDHVKLTAPGYDQDVPAGDYLVLSDDKTTIVVTDKETYEYSKALFPILSAVDEAVSAVADALGSTLGLVK